MLRNEEIRENWIRKELTALPSGSRLLDAGAGEQQYRKYCGHLNYVSQDFGKYIPEEKKEGLQMNEWKYGRTDIICDITNIPEPDESFDSILCTEVLEHLPDPVSALKELSRLLRKEGVLILTAPFCSMTHFAPFHFSTGFSRYFYEHHLPLFGLKIEELNFNGNYFEYLEQELRRLDHVSKRYAGSYPSKLEYLALKKVRKMLQNFSASGNDSNELMHFGCHVLAIKKS